MFFQFCQSKSVLIFLNRFAGFLLGITNTFGTIPGVVAPIVTGYFTEDVSVKQTDYWKTQFLSPLYLPKKVHDSVCMSVILDILPKRETHLCYPFLSAHSCRLEKGILGSSPDQRCGSCYLHHIWQWKCSTMGSNGGEERRGWGKWDHACSYIKYKHASHCAKVTKLWNSF